MYTVELPTFAQLIRHGQDIANQDPNNTGVQHAAALLRERAAVGAHVWGINAAVDPGYLRYLGDIRSWVNHGRA